MSFKNFSKKLTDDQSESAAAKPTAVAPAVQPSTADHPAPSGKPTTPETAS
jgi:hypothetical protein